MSKTFQLSPTTIIRAEASGALLFNRRIAETIELSPKGLNTLLKILTRSSFGKHVLFKNYLTQKGFILRGYNSDDIKTLQNTVYLSSSMNSNFLSAPEALHLVITEDCNQVCQGCFFSNIKPQKQSKHMALDTFKEIVELASEHKVFQIALGGGEPFTHPHFFQMVHQIHSNKMVPNVTTNGLLLDEESIEKLISSGLGQLQLSLNGISADFHGLSRPHFTKVIKAIELCKRFPIRWGINVMVSKENLHHLNDMLKQINEWKPYSVNLIRAKPSAQYPNWLIHNQTSKKDHLYLKKLFKYWHKKANYKLTVDASFSFLLQDKRFNLEKNGIKGCTAGVKMLSIFPDGKVSPCSHVPFKEENSFIQVWNQSKMINSFRDLDSNLEGQCKTCIHKPHCKGCRAIVLFNQESFNQSELSCPSHQPITSWPN